MKDKKKKKKGKDKKRSKEAVQRVVGLNLRSRQELGHVIIDQAGSLCGESPVNHCLIAVKKLNSSGDPMGDPILLWKNAPRSCGAYIKGMYIENCEVSDDSSIVDGEERQELLSGVLNATKPVGPPPPAAFLKKALCEALRLERGADEAVTLTFIR